MDTIITNSMLTGLESFGDIFKSLHAGFKIIMLNLVQVYLNTPESSIISTPRVT